ncbi:MAG: type II toxin-antitoxin system VapC family toxin [Chloroflexi bacterium]|nr:type II toxin-antitoxin system VapC family toxin [Chloroflexota bacterium]
MRLVCDTSVLIDFLRGDSRATQLLESRVQAGDELWGVVVTRAELLAGMRSAERTRTRRLLDVLAWVEIDIALADRAGDLARRYARSHPGIETADYLIAAGTEFIGASLLTTNVRHYPMFTGLAPAYS